MGNKPKVVKKKLWPQYFDLMVSGKKKYEFRLNDFAIEPGDILVLEEWDPETHAYTGRRIERNVTHVSNFKMDELVWPPEEWQEKGFKIISLE